MNLLDSLLDAIVRLDGDALVMHVGEKPYVVTTSEATNKFRGPLAWGQVELSTRVLTTDAVTGMLGQILPLDQRSALDEFGATDYDVSAANHPDERFKIVAARGGDDIWVEMRRHSKTVAAEVTAAVAAPASEPVIAAAPSEPIAQPAAEPAPIAPTAAAVAAAPAAAQAAFEAPPADIQPEPVPVAVAAEGTYEETPERPEPLQVEDLLVDSEPEAEIELPVTIEVSTVLIEESPLSDDLHGIALDGFESVDVEDEESVELDLALSEHSGLELDLDQELDSQTFSLDADVEAGILAATQEWGDDVMTEGELGELLRATAAAVITGETLGITPAHEPDASEVLPVAQAEHAPTASAFDPTALAFDNDPLPSVETHWLAAARSEPEPLRSIEQGAAAPPSERIDTAHASAGAPAANGADAGDIAGRERNGAGVRGPASGASEGAPGEALAAGADAGDIPLDNKVMRELPALVEYQIERDRAAASASELVAGVQPGPQRSGEIQPVHLHDHSEHSVLSTEGVWPVSEDVNLEGSNVEEIPFVPIAAAADVPGATRDDEPAPSRPAAVVLPLNRQAKPEGVGDGRAAVATNLQRLLRLAANRGAATVYVVANTAPLVRVDGEFSTLEGEPAISTAIVERLLAEVSPAGRDATPPSAEWLIDVPEIGRVRCLTFRDHRGPGIIFRMVPARAIAADQLGLSAEVQALCSEADGVVLVTGGRDSGRSTLLTSFVDLINRTRADHIITVESQIDFVHESKRSFISQREVRGEDAMVGAVRSACREEPDVLVIEDMRSHEVAALALEAADAGRLVFASVPGLSTSSAIERLIELFPAERREKAQASLASSLRGVVSQVLLRKLRGGHVAAREVLLNTPAVAGLIMEGKTFQLSSAIESGRRAGMVSFAESLASLVREGVVHPSHAYRKAPSREQLIATLHRDGVDTSIAERLG